METTTEDTKPNNTRPLLEWETVFYTFDNVSKLRIEVHRSKLENGRFIYSIQVGVMRERLSPHIPVIFDRESTSWNSDMPKMVYDYSGGLSKMMKEVEDWILNEKKVEMMVDRDMHKANREKPQSRHTGKTQREREKKANKKP